MTTAPANPPGLLDNYRTAISANPNSAEAHSNLGWGHYGLHQYAEAVKAFEQALSLDRNYVDAHYGLGMALKESGKTKESITAFERVIALAPQLLENKVRANMLAHLARGHINQINTGDWGLDKELRHKEA